MVVDGCLLERNSFVEQVVVVASLFVAGTGSMHQACGNLDASTAGLSFRTWSGANAENKYLYFRQLNSLAHTLRVRVLADSLGRSGEKVSVLKSSVSTTEVGTSQVANYRPRTAGPYETDDSINRTVSRYERDRMSCISAARRQRSAPRAGLEGIVCELSLPRFVPRPSPHWQCCSAHFRLPYETDCCSTKRRCIDS